MEVILQIALLAAMIGAIAGLWVWLLSRDFVYRAFGWTLDHPVIFVVGFCLLLAALIVLGRGTLWA